MSVAGMGIIVTGGASGLGLATVERLAEAGADVAVIDIDRLALGDRIDGLVNCAGVYPRRPIRRTPITPPPRRW